MGTVTSSGLAAKLQSTFGVIYNAAVFDRYLDLWDTLQANVVRNQKGDSGCGSNATDLAATLIARKIWYGGTCSGADAMASAQQQEQGLSMAGSAIGQASAAISRSASIGSSLAGSVPIIGGVLSAVGNIFAGIIQHHATAVANEQRAVCQFVQAANQAFPQIDAAVFSGQITASQGIAVMENAVQQLNQILAPVSGIGDGAHPCNAGCCFQGIALAFVDFAKVYYMDMTPLAQMPAPPASFAPYAPSNTNLPNSLLGPINSGAGVNTPVGYPASFPQIVNDARNPPRTNFVPAPSRFSLTTVALVIGAVAGIVFLAKEVA